MATYRTRKGRVFSGMRPSGRLHLGNYYGALQNWVALQKDYECLYCCVDVHALTTLTTRDDTKAIQSNSHEMILDWLAAGLDPDTSTIFVQSHVPEVMTLYSLLGMMTPMGWLLRVPTFKEKIRQMDETEESVNYGLLGYPVLMTSDIILYKADTVPVGEDQLPHLELAREIVRRFNSLFGSTFPEPQAKLTKTPLILGLDGRHKMSKSMDNHLELASSPEETRKRMRTAFTDPQRLRKSDPGRPWVCNIFHLQKLFNPSSTDLIYQGCTEATLGCVEDKNALSDHINATFWEFRERRQEIASSPEIVREILAEGAKKARTIAQETIREVKERMGLA